MHDREYTKHSRPNGAGSSTAPRTTVLSQTEHGNLQHVSNNFASDPMNIPRFEAQQLGHLASH